MSEPLFTPKEANKSPMTAPDTASKRATTTQNLMDSRGLSRAGVPGEFYPQSMGGQPPQPPGAGGGEMELDEFGQRPATEEEQAVLEQMVYRARDFMGKKAGMLIERMSDKQRPVYQNVGELALEITELTSKLAEAGGQEIDQDTMLAAGEEVVEGLMELGDKAKIWPFEGGSDEYMQSMSMALMFGAETKANQMIEQGDPEVKASYEDKLATEIAREVDRGQGPPDEFFQGIKDAQSELPRRQMHGVK